MDTALDIERYRVKHHQKIKLSRFSTRCDQENMNKLEVKKVLMPRYLPPCGICRKGCMQKRNTV